MREPRAVPGCGVDEPKWATNKHGVQMLPHRNAEHLKLLIQDSDHVELLEWQSLDLDPNAAM